jgi:PKD repeat protein
MTINFSVVSGASVPQNYSWDIGNPFESAITTISAFSTSTYISGYAPGLKVIFRNTSELPPNYINFNYIWNFGDYYNDINNVVSLSTFSGAEHTYIMPGKYNVSLTVKQTQLNFPIDPNLQECLGKYDIQWYWNQLLSTSLNNITWDDTVCEGPKSKWWDSEYVSLQRHGILWSWYYLKTNQVNPVRWEQTKTSTIYEKKWAFEPNNTIRIVPDASFLNPTNTLENTEIKIGIVELIEIPPEAQLQCFTSSLTGVSPYTVTLSPRRSIAGSFPIDRIDWDFNDGSPIRTVTRYSVPDPEIFTFTNALFDDIKDPRNYDAIYTYIRDNNYSLFYPSITCYSSNTFTKNSCSLTIGPILLPELIDNIEIIKQRNTENGIIYACLADSKLFFSIQNVNLSATTIPINIPQNTLINNYNLPNVYFGNPGTGYPVFYNPRPLYIPPDVNFNFVILERDEPRYPEPILTESGLLLKI